MNPLRMGGAEMRERNWQIRSSRAKKLNGRLYPGFFAFVRFVHDYSPPVRCIETSIKIQRSVVLPVVSEAWFLTLRGKITGKFCAEKEVWDRNGVVSWIAVLFRCTGVLTSPYPDQERNKLGTMSGTRAISTTSRRKLSTSFFFPARQGAVGNSRHSDRNIRFFSFLFGLRTCQHPCGRRT